MDRTAHPLAAWLGPALDQLTDDQLDRLTAESERIDARYPDPDEQEERIAALSAAVQYLLGDITLVAAGEIRRAAMAAERLSVVTSAQVATMAIADDGLSEVEAARRANIDRNTLRRALGKLA
jgi:hypothetical protein